MLEGPRSLAILHTGPNEYERERYEEQKHQTIKHDLYKTRAQLEDMYKSEAVVNAIILDGHNTKSMPTQPSGFPGMWAPYQQFFLTN